MLDVRSSAFAKSSRKRNTPSPPPAPDGGEGWGEAGPPLSSVLSPLLRRGARKKKPRKRNYVHDSFFTIHSHSGFGGCTGRRIIEPSAGHRFVPVQSDPAVHADFLSGDERGLGAEEE